MINQDTVRLLQECDAGAKMGVDAIDDVMKDVRDNALRDLLDSSKQEHEALSGSIREHLNRFEDEGKDPPMMASAMSWLKTKAELMMNPGDHTVADLMTDGCNMGVKSLSKYLNQYKAADETSKDCAKKLIAAEEQLTKDLRAYL
ncbi:MAG: hypothetical protein K6A33_01265 [Clostridiales bacterium]|nr:hypothetical protein [Clostridiales bacterium]